MIYPIVKYGQPVLEEQAQPIADFDTPELHQLVEDMFESMYAARGVGLAAPQIGIAKKVAVIDISTGEDPSQKIVLINPEIVSREGSQTGEEGCLSLPTFREPVTRAKKVVVRARDPQGAEFEMSGEDLLARAIQHETDHLNGILFIDRMSSATKVSLGSKLKKLAAERG